MSPPRILLVGEVLVDLVCEQPVPAFADAPAFVPHVGGALPNAALTAARLGAPVALAGGIGADAWGAWLLERLTAGGVDAALVPALPGHPTSVAFVTVDGAGEPTVLVHAGAAGAGAAALGDRLPQAAAAAAALVLTTGTMVGDEERAASLAARDAALAAGVPVVFDPDLRPGRWANAARAVSVARGCVDGAFLVKADRAEATALTGEADPVRAADALLAGGARHVVVTLGADGALLRGPGLRLTVPGVAADVVDARGAGDAVTGVLLAHLAGSDFYPPSLAAALPEAMAAAATVAGRWGPG